MKQRKRKWLSVVCTMAIALSMFILPAKPIQAASFYVYANKSTVYVGDSVTFTVGSKGGCGDISVSGARQDFIWLENSSKSYTVKATHTGTITLSAKGRIADLSTAKESNVYDSASVKVIARSNPKPNRPEQQNGNHNQQQEPSQEEEIVELSKNHSLKSLSVAEGKLTPAFKKDVYEYDVKVKNTTKSVTLSAKAMDSKATVKGTGKKDVEPGKQTFTITCIAEDGSKQAYKVNVFVDEKPLAYVDYNGKKLGVSVAAATMPNKLFDETSITIDQVKVPAWKNEALNLTVLFLEDGKTKDFYFYDEESKKVTSIYRPMGILNENIALIDVPKDLQKRDGMTFTTIDVDGVKFPGWEYNDKAFKNYALLYVMNEAGDYVYYQYEKSEKTLQLYNHAANMTQQEVDSLKQQNTIYMGAIVLLTVLFIIVFIAYIRANKKRKKGNNFTKMKLTKDDEAHRTSLEKETILNLQQEDREK